MSRYQSYLKQTTIALIIGGQSRRFGSLKQMAKIKNRRLIEHAFEKAKALSPQIVAITGPHRFDLPKDIEQYNDIYADKGPLGGIHTALYYCKTPYCAMIPCDMPLLDPEIYRLLYDFILPNRPVAAVSHRGKEPLVSIWPKLLLEPVTEAIRQNHLKLFRLLEELSARFIDLPSTMTRYNSDSFRNINTPEDLEKIRKQLDGID